MPHMFNKMNARKVPQIELGLGFQRLTRPPDLPARNPKCLLPRAYTPQCAIVWSHNSLMLI
jgi:hypothetical protein